MVKKQIVKPLLTQVSTEDMLVEWALEYGWLLLLILIAIGCAMFGHNNGWW
jgi:hypothetical protein